ncbi:MAG: nucleotidyltransferase substrate binding protein, partial [Nitrospinales bacterium]
DNMSFADLIRTGCENNILLSDLSAWQNYRKARGITSHVYDVKKAEEVLKVIPGFLQEAKYLLEKLQERAKNL